MTLAIQFRTQYHRDAGLRKAPQILARNMRGGLQAVGKRLEASAIKRMRRDTGRAQKSLQTVVTGTSLNLKLYVFSTLVEAIVDAYGLKRGIFPDYRLGSHLHGWVTRKAGKGERREGLVPEKAPILPQRRVKKIRRVSKIKGEGQESIRSVSGRMRAKNNNLQRMTFLVARAIYRKGVTASQWNVKALEANKQRIIRDMQDALTRSVNEINRA